MSEFEFTPRIHVVVDDDEVARMIVSAAGTVGLPHATYASPDEFLARGSPEEPGCLVLEYRRSDRSADELVEHLAADASLAMPVIVTSASIDVPTAVRFMRHGVLTVLESPLDSRELSRALAKAIDLAAERHERRTRQREIERRLDELTDDERGIIALLVAGEPTKAIARKLEVSERTIERRRSRILAAMEVSSLVELTRIVTELEFRRRGLES